MVISDAEWQIMNVVWDRHPLTAQEIVSELKDQADWAPSTIKTMLHRLVRKEALTYEAQGNRYFYRPAVERADCVKQAGKSLLERVFAGDPGSLVAHFLKNTRLTPDEITRLRQLLNEQEAQP